MEWKSQIKQIEIFEDQYEVNRLFDECLQLNKDFNKLNNEIASIGNEGPSRSTFWFNMEWNRSKRFNSIHLSQMDLSPRKGRLAGGCSAVCSAAFHRPADVWTCPVFCWISTSIRVFSLYQLHPFYITRKIYNSVWDPHNYQNGSPFWKIRLLEQWHAHGNQHPATLTANSNHVLVRARKKL